MRKIAIMNNKGGVGKTVTAITLADILSRDYGKSVVLVDCDGQMNLTRFYLPEFDQEINLTVYDVLTGESEPVWWDNLMPITPSVDMLPASSALYTLDVASMMVEGSRALFRRLLDFRQAAEEDEKTDFMIFDCPPGFSAASCAALLASNEVIIPVLVDGFSFAGMDDMTAQIASMRKVNSNIRITGVLVTQWHRSSVVTQGETLLRQLGVPVFSQVIRRTDKVLETTFNRLPITKHSATSAAARDYRAWVRELLGEEAVNHG